MSTPELYPYEKVEAGIRVTGDMIKRVEETLDLVTKVLGIPYKFNLERLRYWNRDVLVQASTNFEQVCIPQESYPGCAKTPRVNLHFPRVTRLPPPCPFATDCG